MIETLTAALAWYGCTSERTQADGFYKIFDQHGRVIAQSWTELQALQWLIDSGRGHPGQGKQVGGIDRCLSLHRPWDMAIIRGNKDVENRDWRTPPGLWLVGQWLGIHGGQKWDAEGARFIAARGDSFRREDCPGGIVGAARVIGVIGPSRANPRRAEVVHGDASMLRAHMDSWWWVGSWGIVFDETVELATPIPCKGALGFWAPDPDALAALTAAITP